MLVLEELEDQYVDLTYYFISLLDKSLLKIHHI